jgi:hypothetical protein
MFTINRTRPYESIHHFFTHSFEWEKGLKQRCRSAYDRAVAWAQHIRHPAIVSDPPFSQELMTISRHQWYVDILSAIYQFLPIDHAFLISRVNRLFRLAFDHHLAYRDKIEFRNTGMMLKWLEKCKHVKHVRIIQCDCIQRVFERLAQSCPQLKTLEIENSKIDISDEVSEWLGNLPLRRLKFDNVQAYETESQFNAKQLTHLFSRCALEKIEPEYIPFSGIRRDFYDLLMKAPDAFKSSLKGIDLDQLSWLPPSSFFQSFSHLEEVVFDYKQEKKEVFSELIEYVSTIKTLSLSDIRLFLSCIESKYPIHSLETLIVKTKKTDEHCLEGIGEKLPKLRHLKLQLLSCGYKYKSSTDLHHLHRLSLKTLHVSHLFIGNAKAVEFKEFFDAHPTLQECKVESIILQERVEYDYLSFLFNHPVFKHLGLPLFPNQTQQIYPRERWPEVRSAFVTSINAIEISDPDNEQLAILPRTFPYLRQLTIRYLTWEGLNHLKGLTHLRHLSVTAHDFHDGWLECIVRQFPDLESLRLQLEKPKKKVCFSDAALLNLIALKDLSQVFLIHCGLKSHSLKALLHQKHPLLKLSCQ